MCSQRQTEQKTPPKGRDIHSLYATGKMFAVQPRRRGDLHGGLTELDKHFPNIFILISKDTDKRMNTKELYKNNSSSHILRPCHLHFCLPPLVPSSLSSFLPFCVSSFFSIFLHFSLPPFLPVSLPHFLTVILLCFCSHYFNFPSFLSFLRVSFFLSPFILYFIFLLFFFFLHLILSTFFPPFLSDILTFNYCLFFFTPYFNLPSRPLFSFLSP